MKPLCSTLIASYKRPDLLRKAIWSFRQEAEMPQPHEVIIRLADADPNSNEQKRLLEAEFENCHVIIGEHHGYNGLGKYVTEMLPLAGGEWINLWDDDMLISGQWDKALLFAPQQSLTLCSKRITNGLVNQHHWPTYHLRGVTLIHNEMKPLDGNR